MDKYLVRALFSSIFLLALFAGPVAGAQCNLATKPSVSLITVEPGKTASAEIYFFNVHGDRTTHISVSIDKAPPGFKVELIPELHAATYNISGSLQETHENLAVEPTNISTLPQTEPSPTPGIKWLPPMQGVPGWVPAKILEVRVTAPQDAPLWQDYDLKVSASGNCFDVGEAGPVALTQSRSFSFTIRTITHEFSEQAVNPSPAAVASTIPSPSVIVQVVEKQPNELWFYVTIVFAVLIIILLAFLFLTRAQPKSKH